MKKITAKKLRNKIRKLEGRVNGLEEDKRLDFVVKLYNLDNKELKRHINK